MMRTIACAQISEHLATWKGIVPFLHPSPPQSRLCAPRPPKGSSRGALSLGDSCSMVCSTCLTRAVFTLVDGAMVV